MTTTHLSNYSYGPDCFQDLPALLLRYQFQKIILIGGQKALASSEKLVREALTMTNITILDSLIYGTRATQANIDRLVNTPQVQEADVILAFGGGQALDTCKMVAHHLAKPLITIPTIASTCAAGTAISVIYKEDHSLDYYGFPTPALHLFINTTVIANAPEQYLWAGIGDGISKGPEVTRAVKEGQKRGASLPHAAQLGLAVAQSSLCAFYQYGQEAMSDVRHNRPSQAIEEIALAIIISTGYASNLVNQPTFDYTACHAHAFYNGTTVVPSSHNHLHGVIVSFGVMVLHAYFEEMAELETVAKFNKRLGLPTTLADISLTAADIPAIVEKALTTNEYKNTPFSPERFAQAIQEADQFGNSLKA